MPKTTPLPTPDLAQISEESWAKARAIQPLLNTPVTKEIARECASSAGVHVSTLYRWLDAYRKTERMTALLPDRPGVRAGQTKLGREADHIVATALDELYLARQRPSIPYVTKEIIARCRTAGIQPPHPNTIRRRIARRGSGRDAAMSPNKTCCSGRGISVFVSDPGSFHLNCRLPPRSSDTRAG
jgi:putative transposase